MPRPDRVGVIVSGTRIAERWRDTFVAGGVDAVVEETEAEDAEKGACIVFVPRAQLLIANAIMTDVTKGRRQLGGRTDGWLGAAIVLGVAVVIVALVRLLG